MLTTFSLSQPFLPCCAWLRYLSTLGIGHLDLATSCTSYDRRWLFIRSSSSLPPAYSKNKQTLVTTAAARRAGSPFFFFLRPSSILALGYIFQGAEAGREFIVPKRDASSLKHAAAPPPYSEGFRKSRPALWLASWFKTNQPLVGPRPPFLLPPRHPPHPPPGVYFFAPAPTAPGACWPW